MRPDSVRFRGLWEKAALAALLVIAGAGADAPEGPGRKAVAPIAPNLPGPVVAAMQEGKYAEAATALDRLIAEGKTPADRAYLRFVRGIAERLGGKAAEARATLASALGDDPAGPWASKIRFELAAVELASGRAAPAEALARAEAETLLAPGRKDRLAGVYHAFARRLLKPDDPITPPDPAGAYTLLRLARELAKGEELRASLLFALGRAAQEIAAHPAPNAAPQAAPNQAADPSEAPDAVRDFRAYLAEYPRGADRNLARFHLGEAQLARGDSVAARLTWTDLARDLAAEVAKGPDPALAGLRARSLYRISRTYGIPEPGDDTSLNLGVAALRRFLADAPAHPEAVRAAYEIGASYLHRNQGEPAIEALTAFLKGEGYRVETDEARKDQADLAMTATFQVARTLQGQGRHDRAIEAYKGYLARYPNGPQSADAQRAILDVELAVAADALAREAFAEARAAWAGFVARNPLDGRVPQVLFESARSLATQEKWDEAVAAWDALAGKFPGSEPAGHAQFEAASVFEVEKGDPAAAIERFRQITMPAWKPQADQRVAVMEARALTVATPRAFRSGEKAQLRVTTRNLETLTFSAYKLNAESYFRKKHVLGDVQSLDIGLVAPDAEWTEAVPGYAKFKPVVSTYDLKVAVPGVYVVKVTDEKTLQASALVVGSDLDAIVKVSRDQILVFAQDMKTGRGRKGARVLIADRSGVILEKTTGDDGVLLASWEKPLFAGFQSVAPTPEAMHLRYLVLDGPDAAGSALNTPGMAGVVQGLSPRAYIYTDRPAYRPGHEVAIRGVIREAKDGQYFNPAGEPYKLEVYDARGRIILAKSTTLTPFGTFHESIRLDAGAPVGSYRVRIGRPGVSDFSGGFEVRSYKLEKLDLAFDLPRTVYYRGEAVKGAVVAKYQYGGPAAGRPIEVALPDGRVVRGVTDDAGRFPFEVATVGFAEEQSLRLVARLPGDNVAAAARVMLAIRGFAIDLETTRDVYLDGESFSLKATTLDALGKPTGRDLRVSVLKQVAQGGRVAEREVVQATIKTDEETGEGRALLKVADDRGGAFVIRVAGTDQFGNPIVADRPLTISGRDDEQRLRILADRQSFKVGETAAVTLHSRSSSGTTLLAWEADRILRYRLVAVAEGENRVAWDVDGAQFPNFTLTASRMAGEKFDEARLDVRVERDLRVTLRPTRPSVGPGDEVEVEITAVDQNGVPAVAEVAVALVDRSLLRLFEDKLPPIGPFFYNQTRTGAFSTASSNTFRDEPVTRPVSEAVVEDAERQLAQARNEASRGEVRREAGLMAEIEAAKPDLSQAMPAPASPEMMRRGMGGMGGMGGGMARGAAPGDPRGRMGRSFGALAEPSAGRLDLDPARAAAAKDESDFALFADAKKAKVALGLGDSTEAGADLDPSAQAVPRERFAETAYWNPGVVTGADGRATIRFRAPMALSEYRFSARGVTGADTLVGQATGDLAVRKDFFVDLKVPAALAQGDRPRFLARVHHAGVVGKVEVSLTAYAGERQQVYPRTVEVKVDGVAEILFEPFEVPEADSVRLTLAAKAGGRADDLTVEVPVRAWGVRVTDSASGSSSDDVTAYVGLPPGRSYEAAEMRVEVAPTLRRLLIELALGDGGPVVRPDLGAARYWPPPSETVADRASSLLAATSALQYLRAVRAAEVPEAARLADRVRGLVAELTTAQNDDGGWAWVAPRDGQKRGRSHRMATAQVVQALRGAREVAMLAEPKTVDRALNYLAQELGKVGGDTDARASILYALSGFGRATFEQANTLNRSRQGLTDVSLAHLALTLHDLDRDPLAGEVLAILGSRAKAESAGVGRKPRKFWEGRNQGPWHRGPAETTALASLAFARSQPKAPEVEASADWLLAHRRGPGWSPPKTLGPALAALSAYYGTARDADDRYRLIVSVNDAEVGRIEVAGPAEARSFAVPRKVLKVGDRNKVRFQVEGRGTFGYSATMAGFARDFGPEQRREGKLYRILDRSYTPAEPELEGRALATGFSAAINPTTFTNKVKQVAQGGRARVLIQADQIPQPGRPDWEREFLIVEETLPAGTSLIEGSVVTSATSYSLADDVLTFYFAPEDGLGRIAYDVSGYLPGAYRALPTRIRGAYDPGTAHLGPVGEMTVLAPGEPATDPYRATPDELFARGKALFDLGRVPEAAAPLEELFAGYTPRDDIARDAARMLLTAHIRDYQARKIVQDFEILKEKGPELVIPFDEVLVVGRAYRDIGEHERAYLVFRAIVEASYLEDARVGEVLRQRGRTLDAIAYLLDLWRESPSTASIVGDFFGLSQILAGAAARSTSDPALRRELAEARVTRSELLLQSIRLIQIVLAGSPTNPLADEASLALLGAYLELDDFQAVVRLAPRYAGLYPRSTFLDSFQYSDALGRFQLGEYDRAIEVAGAIARATYKDANGVDQPSPNKWQALYILGQIHDARRQPARAVEYYKQVADRFADAAGAVKALTRKDLKLPEVSVINPHAASRGGGSGPGSPFPLDPAKMGLKLSYRNIAEVDVKVYPVDLMRLYLTRRNLDGIAGIDLAGITPLHESTVKLGDGLDFADRSKLLDLPLMQEGAFLIMARGENLYASGIALVSPLELEVLEEPESGRVRVVVRDSRTKDPAPKVQVKVIGTGNPSFFSGQTDLRGVYAAEGVEGQVTAVARKGPGQYAFYRGTDQVGVPSPARSPQPNRAGGPGSDKPQAAGQSLDQNVRDLNMQNQMRGIDRLQNRYNNSRKGIKAEEAK